MSFPDFNTFFKRIIIIPTSFFKQLSRAIEKFIWGSLHARIRFSTLCNSKLADGAGLPDLKNYNLVALLMRIVDWLRAPAKQWVQLEDFVPLTSQPWAGRQWGMSMSPSLSFLTQQVYTSWNRLSSLNHFSHRLGPMTPLFGNSDFPPAFSSVSFGIGQTELGYLNS